MNGMIPRGLVVSCQALRDEPLYGGDTISKMALAAKQGGAVGIRANTVRDINAIYGTLNGELPIIGLIKREYADSPVYITPTVKEAKALIKSKCSVIALDATNRPRPGGLALEELVSYLRAHTDKLLMADIATYEEAMNAERLGFDYVSTTMRSYTAETKGISIPDIEFCRRLYSDITKATVIAEGGIHTFDELQAVLEVGIDHVIIGGAITRPQNITRDYVDVFKQSNVFNCVGAPSVGREDASRFAAFYEKKQ